MLAYAGCAVRKAVASQQNRVKETARSGIGALAENLPKFYNLSKMPTPKYKIVCGHRRDNSIKS